MNIFENASRRKLRFDSPQGTLTVEQLWDLPLTSSKANQASLDGIGTPLVKQLESGSISLVSDSTPANTELQLKLDIIKHIIGVKKAENAAILDRKARQEEKEKLTAILNSKKEEQLKNLSEAELQERLNKLSI